MRYLSVGLCALLLLPMMAAQGFAVEGAAFGLRMNERARHESLVAESATPVEPGRLDLSLDLSYSRTLSSRRAAFDNSWRKERARTIRYWEWDVTAVYGIMRDLDAGVRAGYVDIKDRNRPFGDRTARNIDDLDLFLKTRFIEDRVSGVTVAFAPELTIPVAKGAETGRLGPGQHFWSLTPRLAATQDLDAFIINADVGYMVPFGRTRKHYSRRFGRATRNTRGVLDGNLGVSYIVNEHVKPEIGLSGAHEFFSGESGSSLITATFGAIFAVSDDVRIRAGWEEPLTGRNSARMRTLSLGISALF